MIRTGFLTSEFWVTITSQVLAVMALVGVIGASDVGPLQDAIGKCIAAGGVFVANAWIVISYIRSRTIVKQSLSGRP